MEIGRRIYYELATGNAIQDTGERSGDVIDTTQDQDFAAYAALTARVPTTVGLIQLSYAQNGQDFQTCTGFKVDITGPTPTLVFSYPDPNVPPTPPVYQKPLTEQVTELKVQLEDSKSRQADILFAMVNNNLM